MEDGREGKGRKGWWTGLGPQEGGKGRQRPKGTWGTKSHCLQQPREASGWAAALITGLFQSDSPVTAVTLTVSGRTSEVSFLSLNSHLFMRKQVQSSRLASLRSCRRGRVSTRLSSLDTRSTLAFFAEPPLPTLSPTNRGGAGPVLCSRDVPVTGSHQQVFKLPTLRDWLGHQHQT